MLGKRLRNLAKIGESIKSDFTELNILREIAIQTKDTRAYAAKRKSLRRSITASKKKLKNNVRNAERILRRMQDNPPRGQDGHGPDLSGFERGVEEMNQHFEKIDVMLDQEEQQFMKLSATAPMLRKLPAIEQPAPTPAPKAAPAPWSAPPPKPEKKKSPLAGLLLILGIGISVVSAGVYFLKRTIRKSVEEATKNLATPPPAHTPAPMDTPPTELLSAPATPPLAAGNEGPGTIISGNFEIEKQIGKGGMGVVYLAKDQTLGRNVAIKRMRDELVESAPDLKAFLEEARLVASLKHPNLVEIHQVAKEPNRLYLIFEFVQGRSLQKILETHGKLSISQAKSVIHQVSMALDYAHTQKITHRDLKPANIMVTDKGIAKVMDFGLAHQTQRTIAKLSRTGASGTPSYMAPEQELGTTSAASDIFALGVTLYQMITGVLPFQGPNFLAQKRESLYTLPSQGNSELSPSVDAIIAKALDPDPTKRYTTAGELSKTFQAL